MELCNSSPNWPRQHMIKTRPIRANKIQLLVDPLKKQNFSCSCLRMGKTAREDVHHHLWTQEERLFDNRIHVKEWGEKSGSVHFIWVLIKALPESLSYKENRFTLSALANLGGFFSICNQKLPDQNTLLTVRKWNIKSQIKMHTWTHHDSGDKITKSK